MALVAVYKNPGNYFVSEGGNRYKWEILEEGGTFASTLEAAGRDFIQTSWSMSDKDEYSPLLISETSISVYDNASGELYSDMVSLLSSNQEDKYILRITLVREKGAVSDVNKVKWIGYIKRGQISKDEDGNAVITLSATDGIDMLNRKTFSSTASSILGEYEELYTGRVTYTSAMATALDKMGLDLDLYITSSHYPRVSGTQLSATDNPWDNVYVDREGYRQRARNDGESDRPIKSIDVVRDILITWGCIMFQWEGAWHILQVNKRGDNSIRRWHYDYQGSAQSPAYEDVTAHVITPGTESVERTRGTLSQLPQYDAVRVNFQHGEYKFMPNPGFDIDGNQFFDYDPADWTIVGPAGGRYENNGNGDGQFISTVVRAIAGDGKLPTTTTGSGEGSVEEFVQDYCDASTGSSDLDTIKIIATSTTNPSGTLTSAAISAYDGNFLPAGTTIFLRDSTQYFTTTLTSRLAPGDTNVFFSSTAGVILLQDIRAKVGGYAYSQSRVQIAQDQRLSFSLSFLPTANGDDVVARFLNYGSSGGTVYAQVKLTGSSSTYYLKKASYGVYEWSTSLEWIAFRITDGDTHSISGFVFEKTPVGGTITTTVGPAIWNALSVLGSPVGYPVDEVRWDNVDVKPILAGNNPNSDSTSTVTYDSTQTTEVARIRDQGVFVGDSPYNPSQFGMSLDSDGLVGTSDWEEAPITGAESNVSHEALLGKVMLRSMRSPRETHAATYFGLESSGVPILVSPWHVLSRSGSEYAPMNVSLSWNRDTTDGTWYKVTESGYFDTSNIIKNGAGFVGSRGGVGESTASFFNNIGNSLFADGSAAITRTTATINAGTVTSISVESITEPIFKADDLIAIMGPDLSFVQARISADQDALATTLSIEDKDNPGTGVTFAEDMPAPAAIYFLEQELLTLARLGEQGFAVTVLGEVIGRLDGNQGPFVAGDSITVKDWAVTMEAGAKVYLAEEEGSAGQQRVELEIYGDAALTEPVYKGATTIYTATASDDLTFLDDYRFVPAGSVPRSDFQITANEISAYVGSPGDKIGTLFSVVWGPDIGSTSNTYISISGNTEKIKQNDTLLIYTRDGSVVKVTAKDNSSTPTSAFRLSDGDGDLTDVIAAGDAVASGSVIGMRIDSNDIEFTANQVTSSNYSAGSAGWALFNSGSAEFNSVTVRGSIEITGTSSGIANFDDAGPLVNANSIDEVPDGSNFYRWAVSGAPPTAAGTPTSSGLYLGSDVMGYFATGTPGEWLTYMDSDGNFYLGGTSGKLIWDGSDLSIIGDITATGTLTGGTVTMGESVFGAGKHGISIDTNNYWKLDTTPSDPDPDIVTFAVGDGTNGIVWNGSSLSVTGSISATGTLTGGGIVFGNDAFSAGIHGINIDANNYWKLDTTPSDPDPDVVSFSVGNGTNGMTWSGTALSVTGAINASSGSITGNLIIGASGVIKSEDYPTSGINISKSTMTLVGSGAKTLITSDGTIVVSEGADATYKATNIGTSGISNTGSSDLFITAGFSTSDIVLTPGSSASVKITSSASEYVVWHAGNIGDGLTIDSGNLVTDISATDGGGGAVSGGDLLTLTDKNGNTVLVKCDIV